MWLLLQRITTMYWFWTPCISLRASLIHLLLSALTSPSTLANDSGFMYWKMSLFCGDFNCFIPSDLNSDLQCKYYLFTKYFKIFYLYTYVIPQWGNFIFGQMGIWGLSCDGIIETYFFSVSLFKSPIHIRKQNRASCKIAMHPCADCFFYYQHILTKDL